jgi:hypothetical protein
MTTATVKVLVSSLARFVNGDIKGGAAAHAYRKEIITTAVEQAFKGNYSPITEAKGLTEGTAKKTRAYAAGFAALGPIGDVDGIIKVAYVGSLNANENKPAREMIAAKTAASVSAFFVAFDAIMAEKAEKKAPKAKDEPAAPTTAPTADEIRSAGFTSLDNSVAAMETALRTNALTGEQSDRIVSALVASLSVDQLNELLFAAGRQLEHMQRNELATA